jgi:hypothetical protein
MELWKWTAKFLLVISPLQISSPTSSLPVDLRVWPMSPRFVRPRQSATSYPESFHASPNLKHWQRVYLPGSSTPMGRSFSELAFTPLVKAQQQKHGSRRQYERMEQSGPPGKALGHDEQTFIGLRDSFYMASVSETGWPYTSTGVAPRDSFTSSIPRYSVLRTCGATSSTFP